MVALRVEGLTKLYDGERGCTAVDLTVAAGEVFGLLGPNGSGKSTLLKVLATRTRPDSGRFEVLGVDGTCPEGIRPLIGVLPEGVAHFGELTGFENAWFYARAYAVPRDEAEARLKDLFVWAALCDQAHRPVGTYSYGMKRKLSLIQALVHRPAVLLLDEPSLGLDYASRLALHERLRALARGGVGVLLSTNDLAEARSLCDRVGLLHRGRLVVAGRPEDLLAELGQGVEISLTLAEPVELSALGRLAGLTSLVMDGDRLVALAPDGQAVLADLVAAVGRAGGRVLSLRVKEPDLGDVYLRYAGAEWKP